ncbi:hypothetical protein LSH36_16g14030 [Paralvinella palmiformis]|uniref:Uncharacterized protein n=1 Tax=Paralvinella palmiformis TaxID=53620 RepID=A0AAD9NHA5_9ANNE|nr:hypothetical protein LSH36_16g14030 [Paralvinella palmiformis]
MKPSETSPCLSEESRITILSSRNKRPAPKPPSTDPYINERSHDLDTDTDNKLGHPSVDTGERGRHLAVQLPGEVSAADKWDQECGHNERNFVLGERKSSALGSSGVRGDDVPVCNRIVADGTGSGRTVIGRTGIDGVEVSSPEDNVTSVSVLSDSGTVSSSSGYTSDLPDVIHRSSAAMRSQSPVPEQRDQEQFGEDECVLDFDEEDEDEENSEESLGRHTLLYKEYRGEDFARYLEDDQESGLGQTPVAPPRKSRYAKKSNTHVVQPLSTNGSIMDYERKKGLRQRFSQIFTLSRQHKNVLTESASKSRIQNFSFADSKMGEHMASGDLDRSDTALSDFGLRQTWSGTDTLAVRSLKRRSDISTRPKRSSSVGDILERPNIEFGEDFESRRKSQIYDSKQLGKDRKKSSIWSKLGKSKKKKVKSKYELDNTVDNPLITGDKDDGDVHL